MERKERRASTRRKRRHSPNTESLLLRGCSEQAVEAERVPHANIAIRHAAREAKTDMEIELLQSDMPGAAHIGNVPRWSTRHKVSDVLDEEITFRSTLHL